MKPAMAQFKWRAAMKNMIDLSSY